MRVGPNEVSFANVEMVKEVYGQGASFLKAPMYEMLSIPPLGIFAMTNRNDHRQRRKLLSHAFSQSNLHESEPLILLQVGQLIQTLNNSRGQSVNVMDLFRMFALDVVGMVLISFGRSP